MEITSVTVDERRSGIPLMGWESVENALRLYASGGTRGSRSAESKNLEGFSGDEIALYVVTVARNARSREDALVEKLLIEAKAALTSRDRFSKSYDYDAMGTPFFKSTVDICVLDRAADMFQVGLHASYVGSEPEVGLAEQFGIPRTLLSARVEIELNPLSATRFAFDFAPVLEALAPVLDCQDVTIQKAMEAMLRMEDGESLPWLVLQERDGLQVALTPGRVDRRFDWRHGNRDTFVINGSVLEGDREQDYASDDENAKSTPTFRIIVLKPRDAHGSRPSIWRPEEQTQVIALANQIATALQ